MASDDKGVAHLAKAVDLVVFVDVGNVGIVERVLYLGQEIHDVGVGALGFLLGGVLVDHRCIATLFVVDGVGGLRVVPGGDDVLVLEGQLLGAV